MNDLEGLIGAWREHVRGGQLGEDDIAELEAHLRDQVDDLATGGLADDEAFLVAIKRLGATSELTREFARAHTERLWKQLLTNESETPSGLWVAIGFAVVAALVVQVPRVFGMWFDQAPDFWLHNVSLVVLPVLAAWLLVRRAAVRRVGWLVGGLFAVTAVLANAYPFGAESQTAILSAIHVPILGWAVVGLAHMGGEWRSHDRRMDFVRFTGEAFVYFVLMGLGGGVLIGFTVGLFDALGLDAELFVPELLPSAMAGALLIAAWLVEEKQQVIENIAPVLTAIFTPLFGVMLFAALVVALGNGVGFDTDRELLILFDLLLVVVTGLLLYTVSARDPRRPVGLQEYLHLGTVILAFSVDVIGLWAMVDRISEFGASPNKVVALGLNVVLLATLGWSARWLLGFIRDRHPFTRLEHWQTTTLPIHVVWSLLVVVIVPLAFAFA